MTNTSDSAKGGDTQSVRRASRWANACIEFFANTERFANDPDQEHRARLVVSCGLTVLIWGPFFALAYWAAGFETVAVGVLLAAGAIGASLFGLRLGWPPMVVGNFFALSIFAIHGLMVVQTGGPSSPALPWLAVTLIAGFALGGPGWGVCWLIVAGLELGLIALGLLNDMPWQRVPDGSTEAWLHLAAVAGLCGVMFTFAHVFETQKERGFKALQRASDREREANEAKSRFLANVSHEIRTPMNAVLGMSELVLGSELPPKEQHRVETIHRSASALLDVLNDILDLSKLEAGHFEIEEFDFELRDVVDQVMDLLGERARDKGLEIHWRVDPDVPHCVRADPGRIRQIMLNLVGNAVKFTDQGRVDVQISLMRHVEGRDWVRFRISDTGPGILAANRAQLFVPFSQIDSSATRIHGGTGLGLSISRELANRMGGDAWFAGGPGIGSTFGFDLPLRAVSSEDHVATGVGDDHEPFVSFEPGALTGAGLRVLIAEDNPINQTVIRAMVEELGFEVEVVDDGLAAVEAVAKETPALILMDCQMPRMDGYDAVKRIREMEREEGGTRLPIVGITAHAMRGDRERCIQAGMDDYMAKPIQLAILGSTIQRLLQ